MQQLWFRTDMFAVDPKEDEETNPFCYGKELACWLESRFRERGYSPEPVFPEDFGWCVMLSRESGRLWIGCGNMRSELYEQIPPEKKLGFVPDGAKLTWTAFVATDKPAWSFRAAKRRAAIEQLEHAAARAAAGLEDILKSERRILLVEEP